MKKKRILLLFLISCCFALLLVGCSSSGNPYKSDEPDNGYVINSLNVKIDASAGDRSMRITEQYTFTFDESSHGFYRDIAINSGEKIRDIAVYARDFHDEFTVSHENFGKILRIRIGDEDAYVYGRRTCTIAYTMITPKHAQYPNALVLNAIGQGWTCEIEQAHVDVILPSATVETPRYYYGGWGDTKDAVGAVVPQEQAPAQGEKTYSFDVSHLNAFEGVTVYYFLGKGALKSKTETLPVIVIVASLVLVGLAVLFLFLLGRSPELTPVTNFYPPKHPDAGTDKKSDEPMDPVEMGYLIDSECSGKDVTSLIFYFASKGYLEIEDPDGELTLVHKKDLPETAPAHQQVFFKKLFASGPKVEISSLTNKMYTAVSTVQTQVKGQYTGKLYDKTSRAASIFLSALSVLLSLLTLLAAYFKVSASSLNLIGVLAVLPAVAFQLLGTLLVHNRLKLRAPIRYLLYLAGIALIALTVTVYALAIHADVLPQVAAVFLGIGVAGCAAVAPFVSRRTPYYTNELNEIMGFKDFLQSAEKERLEMLLQENPQYYYDILPYANVLGVSSIWENKFKNIAVEPPRYYSSHTTVFDLMLFNSFYRNSYAHASTVAVSRPSSASRSGGHIGGGHHGGFSGGGHGGGGGGRW